MRLNRMLVFIDEMTPEGVWAAWSKAVVRVAWEHRKYLRSMGVDLL